MKTLLIFSRHGVDHLIIVDGDKRHLNGVNLQDIGITGAATEAQLELIELVYDGAGNINYHGYQISSLSPLSVKFLTAHEVSFIAFAKG
jgi:hypothetical protein